MTTLRATVLTILLAGLPAGLLLGSSGCTASQEAGQPLNPKQRYDYAEVKRRVKQVPIGATAIEVMVALGSPAEQRRGVWIYRQDRVGLIVPGEYLVVRFEGNRYAGYEVNAVILGEEVG